MSSNPKQADIAAHRERSGKQALQVAEALRRDIVSGALPPETVLRQERISERYQVSRMPVRDALRILEAEGIVTIRRNRGAIVTPISVDDLREIYEMRIAAETLALRLSIPELSNTQIEDAKRLQAEMERAELSDFGSLNAGFHTAIYAGADRPRLQTHIGVLAKASDRYLRYTVAALDYADKSNAEHRQLLEYCLHRDTGKAVKTLERHIADAADALIGHLQKQQQTGP